MKHLFVVETLFAACIYTVRGEVFDYVIAGAGTAGLVVANRLSARSGVSVAVIEPGDDLRNDPNVTSIDFNFANFNTSINFQYTSIKDPRLGDRSFTYRAGKAIGGTSSVNGMVYIRGDKAQYDAWEKLGNHGWNWDSVFSAYKRGEDFTIPTSAQLASGALYEERAHGFKGPLTVGFPFVLSNSTYFNTARETWKSLGLDVTKDINGGTPHGFSGAPQSLDRDANVREDSARAYYRSVESGRKNLKIIKGTVRRITWGKDRDGEAVADGLEYTDATGALVKVQVKRDVILSASAYVNPLILESSGVGNPKILKKLGIETKVALPGVGESLQDHHALAMTYGVVTPLTGRTPYAAMPNIHDVFGSTSRVSALATATGAKLSEWASALSNASDGAISPSAIEKRFKIQHDLIFNKNVTIAELFPTNAGSAFVAQFWTSMPFGWGSVHLSSQGKTNEPAIDPRLMFFDFDLEMLAGVGRLSQKAYNTSPLKELFTTNISPGFEALPINATDGQWEGYVRQNVQNGMHVVGTCAMLPKELGGVVDARVKVHGTRNVRVVDASIIPMQLSGHTMAPVYGVAERAAELIIG